MIPGRQRCLEVLVEHLAPTRLGRHFGLSRLHTLDDLRATIGIHDRDEHEREVEERLGFGVYDDDDPRIAIFRQARHGLTVRMALLCLLAPDRQRA